MKPERNVQTTKSQIRKLRLMMTMVTRPIMEDAAGVVLTILSAQGTVDSVVVTTMRAVVETEALLNQEEVPKTKVIRFMSHPFVTCERMISESSFKEVVQSLTSF
jgi:hypothetical protein